MALGKTDRWLRNVTVVLGLAWMAVGCGPGTLAYLLGPIVGDNVEPKYKIANPDKEITVVVASKFESIEIRPDVQPISQELAETLAQEMRKHFKENRENVKIVPPLRVQPHLSKLKSWDTAEMVQLGDKFKADYVIALRIQNVSLITPGSLNSLYQGKADVKVVVYDVHAGALEAEVHKDDFRCSYPSSHPVDASNTSPAQFRNLFTSRMARDLSRWFAAYPSNQKYDID